MAAPLSSPLPSGKAGRHLPSDCVLACLQDSNLKIYYFIFRDAHVDPIVRPFGFPFHDVATSRARLPANYKFLGGRIETLVGTRTYARTHEHTHARTHARTHIHAAHACTHPIRISARAKATNNFRGQPIFSFVFAVVCKRDFL